jgi:hypothetical protein
MDGYRLATNDGKQYVSEKLPSLEAMSAIAYFFANADTPADRWAGSMAAILSAQPSRIGELLRQRVDCEIETERQGRQIYSLRWWPEKGGKPRLKDFVIGSDPWVPILKEAITYLREFGRPAREIALWYEKHPKSLYLPEELETLRKKEIISLGEAAEIYQYTNIPSFRTEIKKKGVPIIVDPETNFSGIRFVDLEALVIAQLPHGFPFADPMTKRVRYSELLCLTRRWETADSKGSSRIMFNNPTLSHFQLLLNKGLRKHSLTELDGSIVRIKSHQFRHRWEDSARIAGIDETWRNQHAGRARRSHADAYENRNPLDRAEDARTKLGLEDTGILFGSVSVRTPTLPMYLHEVEALIEAHGKKKAIVVTVYGVCANNFGLMPCTMFLQCLTCKHHVCIKGLPGKTEFVRRALEFAENSLRIAREAAFNGDYGVQKHIDETMEPNINILRGIVQVMDDPNFPVGTQVMVAQDGRNDPLAKSLQLRINYEKQDGRDCRVLESTLSRIVAMGKNTLPTLKEGL